MHICVYIYSFHLSSGGGLVTKLYLTLMTPWTVVCQSPLSMEFPRQEYWHALPFPSPGSLPHAGIEPRSPALQGDGLPTESLLLLLLSRFSHVRLCATP